MTKKVKSSIEEKLQKYISQRDEIEVLIDKYLELYQRLNGAIEATKDILNSEESGGDVMVEETEPKH